MVFEFYVLTILQLISLILILFMFILIIRMKDKQQIHYAFLFMLTSLIIWSGSRFIQMLIENNNLIIILEKFVYVGICLLSVFLLLTGIIFAKTKIQFSWKYLFLFIIPVITLCVIFIEDKLFITKYSFVSTEFEYGPYYIIHEIYSYLCIVIGVIYLLYYSIKNSGFFSKQSIFIVLGILIPLIVVFLSTQKIVSMLVFYENISLSLSMLFFMIAIFKFKFLNIVPIALQLIVDLISDSYIVINENHEVIDYNQTFVNTFQSIKTIKRKERLLDLLSNLVFNFDKMKIMESSIEARNKNSKISFEEHMTGQDVDKYFQIEITPIISKKIYLGTIILFKDISEHKKDIEIIKHNQEILMEQERMASLGQMIGGIAHNLNTPIMSLAGGIEALKDLTNEYKESIEDNNVSVQDHYEIAEEMQDWLDKMKPYCSYMTDIIGAVKGQAVQMNDSSNDKFTVQELVKKIDVLMKHELKKMYCTLATNFNIDLNTEIKGEVNNLVQVIDNIIINSIHAYEGKSGTISFEIYKDGDNAEFILKDYGKGIPKEIENRLFTEMLTTKGKNGTGLGLYMSYSTIKGRFLGNMRFETKENEGTTFFITIPCIPTSQAYEEVM